MPTFERDRVSPAIRNLALRNESALLVAVRSVSHAEAGRRLGLPKQSYQDWRDEGHLKDFMLVLAAYGQKIVPFDTEAYGSDDIAAMAHLAQKGIVAIKPLRHASGGIVTDEPDTVRGDIDG